MNEHDYHNGFVELTIQRARAGKQLRCRVQVAAELMDCFNRLPRDRELAFLPDSARRAFKQQQERRALADQVAAQLTAAILKAVEADDTINGYEPEEWKRMHSQTS